MRMGLINMKKPSNVRKQTKNILGVAKLWPGIEIVAGVTLEKFIQQMNCLVT